MMAAVGACVGLLAAALKATAAAFSAVRLAAVSHVASSAGALPATLVAVTLSAALAALAAAPVALLAPAAAGAGVAEVMAALNGVVVPRAFNVVTLAVKAASTAAAVGSGLPVGPEGPMVAMGAAVGAGLASGASTTLGVTAGPRSLGTRSAPPPIGATLLQPAPPPASRPRLAPPYGGLLFAFEELAVPFSPALAAQVLSAVEWRSWRSTPRALPRRPPRAAPRLASSMQTPSCSRCAPRWLPT